MLVNTVGQIHFKIAKSKMTEKKKVSDTAHVILSFSDTIDGM